MKKFSPIFLIPALFFLLCSTNVRAGIDLWDWGINIDGTSYCLEGPCDFDFFSTGTLGSLAELPLSIDFRNFNLTDDFATLDGLGTLTFTITGEGSHSVSVYFNYDLDYSLNGSLNETGTTSGSPQLGQLWEIDEIGWGSAGSYGTGGKLYRGDIFDNVKDSGKTALPGSLLDNQIFYASFTDQFLAPPIEDTALAMSWDFDLLAGETAIISFVAGTTPSVGFYTVQQDLDSGTYVYLSSSFAFDSDCPGTVDCFGVCDGLAVLDGCGTCDSDPSNNCFQDCNDDFGGQAYIDNCDTCVGGNTGLSECGQDCAGTWGGDAVIDNCGTCDSDPGNDCIEDCSGTWGGDAVADNCGTCDSDPGNDCITDCNGDFGGSAVVDDCGTCDSDPSNDCVQDCAGTWGGNAVADNCGTCDFDSSNDCVE
ncbi:MAG: MSCRAMM family adhesin SdrC, partial [Proteobacteria bacterium]|nr:MSCRAMM family adhesin SdrC [Pseudomonadota bacterium]